MVCREGRIERQAAAPKHRSAALLSIMLMLSASVAAGADRAEAETAAQQESLHGILTTFPANAVTAQRMTCMLGEEPGRVVAGRRAGKDFIPDAADTCVAVLVRTARDGRLPDLYRSLVTELGGAVEVYETLPAAIGDTALGGKEKVAIGNGKDADVPPSLAFDAGFTVSYLKGDARAGKVDPIQLKRITESCLAGRADAGTCFSVGYAQGGRALDAGR